MIVRQLHSSFIRLGLFILASVAALSAKGPDKQIDISTRPWYHYIREEMPTPKIPTVQTFKLANGIEVYFLPSTQVPLVRMQIIIAGGGLEVASEKLGLQTLWGETIAFSGSNEMGRDKLSQYLENRATSFGYAGGKERSAFTISSLSNYFARDFTTLFAVLQNPAFASEDFELLRKRQLQNLEHRDENPSSWAALAVSHIFWGDSVRGRYATIRSVKNISRDDLLVWQKKLWRGERMSLAVSGNITEIALRALLEKTFGKLAVDANAKPSMQKMQVPFSAKANEIYELSRDIPQTTVIYKAPGMKHTDKEYYALRIFDFLLGGDSFNSYITQKIRTEKGWAYSAYSTFDTDNFTGSVVLFTQTANMNLPDVIAAIDDILAKPEKFVTDEKIAQAKLSLRNKFVFLFENPTQYLNLYLQLKWDGLNEDYLSKYMENLSLVRREDVLRIAREYYTPEKFTVLLCGPQGIYEKKSPLRPQKASVLKLEK